MRRLFTLILALLMLCMPVTVFAEETTPTSPEATSDPTTVVTETTEATEATQATESTEATEATEATEPSTPATQPEETPTSIANPLYIDSWNLYDGMDKTYQDGYVPKVENGKAYIVLPLLGQTYDNKVTVTADLGSTTDSPFVFGNYSQTEEGNGTYVFTFEIPLASSRINGAYPVTFNATYIDVTGSLVTQPFIVHVTITDGKKPVDPNAVVTPGKEAAQKPELFISACVITPNSVSGNEEFSVKVTIENIGNVRARNIRLSFGGASMDGGSPGIIPVETNNAIHLENITAGESCEATFKLMTTRNVLTVIKESSGIVTVSIGISETQYPHHNHLRWIHYSIGNKRLQLEKHSAA